MARRAICFGLNAYPSPNTLNGCLADAHQMQVEILQGRGYQAQALQDREASCARMMQATGDLLATGRSGDDLTVSYSGHGAWVRDTNGDEPDGKDETLVPIDFDFGDPSTWLTDDKLASLIAKANLPAGCSVTFVFDSCHAGTGLREFQPAALSMPARHYRTIPTPASMQAAPIAWWRKLPLIGGLKYRPMGTRIEAAAERGKGDVVLLAATRPKQLAADAYIAGAYHGAHTYALGLTLRNKPTATLAKVRLGMETWLNMNGYGGAHGQTPTLYGSVALRAKPAFASH